MQVFKFGGASVKNAEAVRNVVTILEAYKAEKMVIVISAMGKMTNKLEALHEKRFDGEPFDEILKEIGDFHKDIAEKLGGDIYNEVVGKVGVLEAICIETRGSNYQLEYDKIVSMGEILSTCLVESYLRHSGLRCEWFDVRNVIKTDNNHGVADVDWTRSGMNAQIVEAHLNQDHVDFIVTQGFIGSSSLGNTTTLGREGSDYSAAILANLLNAEKVVIWKDVEGMLNADPKWFNNAVKLDRISYREAVELSYFGASVIHPKTIKPLQNKSIPLYVKSFENPQEAGTIIHDNIEYDKLVPSYIFRTAQTLVSISPKDFSFIMERNLMEIFEVCSAINLRINLMQHSALNFSLVIDNDERKLKELIELLSSSYSVRYNKGLKLLTIRHYDSRTVEQLTRSHDVLLEQKSRQTLRIAMRETNL